MNQHFAPKIFNERVATPWAFTKFYRSTACFYVCKANICNNCQKFQNKKKLMFKNPIKNKRQ